MNSLERSNPIEAQPIKKHTAESRSINPLEQRTNTSIALINDVYKQKQWVDIPEDIKYLLYKTLKSTEESQRDWILDDIINFINEDDNPNLQIEAYLNWTIKTETDILADNSQQSNEQKESDRQRHALQLAESLSSLKWEWKEYSWVLQRIVALKDVVATEWLTEKLDNEIASILQALESPQTLLAISLDLQEQDRKHWTHTYDAFKSSVIAMAPSFREKFSEADSRAMIALWTDTLRNTTRSDSKITQSTDDGFKLEATLNCTKRAISYKGSEYALSSDIGAKSALEESERIDRKLQENLKPLNESLAMLKALRSRLDATSTQNKPFSAVSSMRTMNSTKTKSTSLMKYASSFKIFPKDKTTNFHPKSLNSKTLKKRKNISLLALIAGAQSSKSPYKK